MKTIFLKTVLLFGLIISFSCSAQRVTKAQYINFYNEVSPKLNLIVPNKTQYYGGNFSVFYNQILNNNLIVKSIGVYGENDNSIESNTLSLEFTNDNIAFYGLKRGLQYPVVYITFNTNIPNQIRSMLLQYGGMWNSTFESFFSNMIIQKIEFVGINGYDNPDRTIK